MNNVLRAVALVLMLVFAAGASAQSEELQDISRLLKQGQHAQALDRVNQYLATRPRDAQGRFLKGLILAEQSKVPEAIDVFTRLSQDYPDLPEPHNNLAVLYAGQGQYEKARQALEMSIRTHPSYATAYENLGDVYTKLASQAYDKALQYDSTNAAAQSKLSLIREMITSAGRPSRTAARGEPVRVAEAPKASPAAASSKATTPPKPAAPEAKPAADSKSAPAATAAAKSVSPVEAKPAQAKPAAAADAGASSEDVIKAVRTWAQAWANKDVNAYLSFYARDFRTPGGETRAVWQQMRRQRISAPKKIEVGITNPKVAMKDGIATVSFTQHYRSDQLKVDSTKTLVLARSEGRWLIQQERVGN